MERQGAGLCNLPAVAADARSLSLPGDEAAMYRTLEFHRDRNLAAFNYFARVAALLTPTGARMKIVGAATIPMREKAIKRKCMIPSPCTYSMEFLLTLIM
jgi:hypothetical protein